MRFLKEIIGKFVPKTSRQREYEYLSKSLDLADLERRQRKIERGQITF